MSSLWRHAKRIAGAATAITAIVVLILDKASAVESSPEWFTRPFQYVVINQDVRGILAELGRNAGVPVILSDKVGGRVHGKVVDRAKNDADRPTAGEFLNRLTEANALTWYFDGSILYVSADQEYSTQFVEVGALKPDAIVTELRRLALMDERFSVRSADDAGLLSVSGPPAFIAVVRQVVEKMRPPALVAGDDPRVRVFRGGAPAEVVRAQNEQTQPQASVARPQQQNEARRESSKPR
jgi:type II secretory pathway component GspD/PulD (secretin)